MSGMTGLEAAPDPALDPADAPVHRLWVPISAMLLATLPGAYDEQRSTGHSEGRSFRAALPGDVTFHSLASWSSRFGICGSSARSARPAA